MRRITFRVSRSIKLRVLPAELYCSTRGSTLATLEREGRIDVEPCRRCQPFRPWRVFAALLFLVAGTLPLHAYDLLINGQKITYLEAAAGTSVTFSVSGSGQTGTGGPACDQSNLQYAFESDGITHTSNGTSVSVSLRPGFVSFSWSRSHSSGVLCEGFGGVAGTAYGFVAPTLIELNLDPPNPKIHQVFRPFPTARTCPAHDGPNASDPCKGDFSWTVDYTCNRSPCDIASKLGPITITGKLTNPAGTSTKAITVDVGATQAPAAFFFAPSNVVAGTPLQFTNQTSNGYRSLLWDFGDGTFSTEENPVHTFAAADDHEVKLIATNEIGTDTFSSTMFVQARSGGNPPSAANFTWTPAKPVTGQTVQFNDASTGTITRWRWSFGDGTDTLIEQNPSHTFRAQAVYNVELWASNAFGRKGIVLFVPVQNNASKPLADFEFSPTTVRVGSPVQFTDTSAGATSWSWDFGENGATSSAQHPVYTYKTAGQKGVTLTVTNAAGQDSRTKFFACHGDEPDQLEAKFTFSPSSPEAGEQVKFTDLSTGSPESWSWVISDGTQSNLRNLTHTFAQPGQYGVSLRVDKGSQHHISVQVVNVGSTTGPIPDFTWAPGTPAPGETVRFTNLSQNATSYSWAFGDGTNSDAIDPTHQYTLEGAYSVKLTAFNGTQSQSITKKLTVSTAPIPPEAAFIASPNPASVGDEVRFTDTSTGAPTRWNWDFGYSNERSTRQNPTHRFPFEGTFQVKLVVFNDAGSSTITLPVVIKNEKRTPDPNFDWEPDPAIATREVAFRDRSSNSPRGWSWTFGDGGTGSGSAPVHTYAKPGNYNVTLRVSNEAGESELTRVVPVSDPPLSAEFEIEPANPAAGKPAKFRDRSIGQVVAWKWIVDGSVVGTSQNLTWTFFSGGEHAVGLEVRGSTGNEHFRQKGVTVIAPPVASFKAAGALVFGGAVAFVDTSTGKPTVRRWYFDDAFAGNGQTVNRSFHKTGSVTVRLEVANEAGKDSLTRFYSISPDNASAPRIRKVTPQFGPCFYSAYPITTPIEVDVDWRKHHQKLMSMELNGAADPPVTGAEPTMLALESRRLAFDSTINNLEITAIGDGGSPSPPTVVKLLGISVPDWIVGKVARAISEDRRKSWGTGVFLPLSAWESKALKFPKLLGGGEFKITKTQFKFEKILRTDCSVDTYAELSGGLKIGKGFGGIKGSANHKKKLTEMDKVLSDELNVSLEGFGGMEASLAIDDAIPNMKPLCESEFIDKYICKAVKFKLEGQGSLGGSMIFTIANDGSFNFKDTEKYLKLQVTGSGAVTLGSSKFEAFGGGKGNFKLGNFSDPHLVKKADLNIEFGAKLVLFGSLYEKKTGWGCTFTYDNEAVCGQNINNLTTGTERAWDLRPVALIDRSIPVEASSTQPSIVLENVSSLADPSAAFRDGEAVVVYLSENASASNTLQRLDVKAFRHGEAQSVTADANGDFNPAVVVDANKRAIVAWERIKDASISHADLPTLEQMPRLTREMEIAVSLSNSGSSSWTSAEMLTSNDVQDRQPAFAALDDGKVILTWIRETAGGEQQIVARVLNGSTWSPEQNVGSAIRGVTEIAIAAQGSEARLVVSHAGSGDESDLSFFSYDGTWSERRTLTTGADDDISPVIAWVANAPHAYWLRGGSLVGRPLSGGDVETIRPAVDATAVNNPAIAVRNDGTPVILWSSGSDLRAVLRDAKAGRWSTDVVLTDHSRSHTALSAWFDGGTLHASTLATILDRVNVPSIINGEPVLIEGVARPGRSDLSEVVTSLEVDLIAVGSTFAAEPRQPVDGESVTISIDLQNNGQVPVRDVAVDLVRGGTLAGAAVVAGDWMPGETKRVDIAITHQTSNGDLLVIVDPSNATSDARPANNRAAFSFRNQLPVACFQASAGSGASPLTIALDAACSLDADGTLEAFSWSFGDGSSGTGSKITHTFTTAGTHEVILTVTDSMGAKSSRVITIDAGVATDFRSSDKADRLYFAVVGRLTGARNTYFVSDLSVVNTDLGNPLTIDAVYMPDGRPDTYRRHLTVAPGAMLQMRDVLAHLFGATNGAGSLRLDLSHGHAVAIARTYNDQPTGTAGLSYDGLTPDFALRDGERGVIPQHWLAGYRTNIGFTEIDGTAAEITVRSFAEDGSPQGEDVFAVDPHQHIQINAHPLLQSRGRIELSVRGGAVIAYASTVDGKSGDPIFQLAERIPYGGRSLLIPIVGRLSGVNNTSWRSDVRVSNVHDAAQEVTMSLRTPNGTHVATYDAAPGATLAWDDVITNAFPQLTGDVGGSLLVTAAGPIVATSRTFNQTAGGTYGLYVPARPEQDLTAEGESAWLAQLSETPTYRCNLGISSFHEGVVVSVRAFDESGITLGVKEYEVGAGQNRQIGRLFFDMGIPLPVEAAGAEVTVLRGKALIYASVIDNRTGDSTYVEAR